MGIDGRINVVSLRADEQVPVWQKNPIHAAAVEQAKTKLGLVKEGSPHYVEDETGLHLSPLKDITSPDTDEYTFVLADGQELPLASDTTVQIFRPQEVPSPGKLEKGDYLVDGSESRVVLDAEESTRFGEPVVLVTLKGEERARTFESEDPSWSSFTVYRSIAI